MPVYAIYTSLCSIQFRLSPKLFLQGNIVWFIDSYTPFDHSMLNSKMFSLLI